MQPTVKVLLSGLVFAFSLPNLGATSANATDLVFASLSRGASFVGLDGNVRVSVDFRIRNRNAPTAGIFKTAAEARGDPTNPRAWFTLPLRVGFLFPTPCRGDGWYAWTRNPLPAGGTMGCEARVIFPATWRGRAVSFRLIADSCAGEEFAPPSCRVRERNEFNNASPISTLVLPP
jgi:hypothetical protein